MRNEKGDYFPSRLKVYLYYLTDNADLLSSTKAAQSLFGKLQGRTVKLVVKQAVPCVTEDTVASVPLDAQICEELDHTETLL